MKKAMISILCNTGITLVVLAAIATVFGARFILVNSVFQSFLANVFIYLGLQLTHRFESEYAVLEYTLDIGYTIGVVLMFGLMFNWYSSTPIWILTGMAVIIYLAGIFLNIFYMRQDIHTINHLLKQRNEKHTSKETEHDTHTEC